MDDLCEQRSSGDERKIIDFIEVTLIESADPLAKRYAMGPDGRLEKGAPPFLVNGTATRLMVCETDFAEEFAAVLAAVGTHSCLVLGSLSDSISGAVADITTKSRHAPREQGDGSPLIWRGKDWLSYRKGVPAVLGLDHDAKDIPAELRKRLHAEGGLIAVLEAICPSLRLAARVSRPSPSTGIMVASTGETSDGGGSHLYIPIADGARAADFVARLHERLTLAGWGFPFVTESGCVSVRSLIDLAASGVGERLWFEAPAILGDGLAYSQAAREPQLQRGGLLDTDAALNPLTVAEAARVEQMRQELRASVADYAAEKRRGRAERVRAEIVRHQEDVGSVEGLIDQLRDAEDRGVLNGRHVLRLDDGRMVSVADVLNDRAVYHRETCADPLEPEYAGRPSPRGARRVRGCLQLHEIRSVDAAGCQQDQRGRFQ
jgi:hypothetical protein